MKKISFLISILAALCLLGLSAFAAETTHEHTYETVVTAPTCTAQGTTVYTCAACGDSYTEYADRLEHLYDDGVCTVCGVSILGSNWLVPDFAQGDYTMVIVPDTQCLVEYWPEIYGNQMQWIADHRDALNIQAVLHMGDMVNLNNDTQWTICEQGTETLEEAGIPWMPMRGNHDDSEWFNRYYDYETYGTNKSWFGGSYHEAKLDHTYWFVTVGEQEYMILSLGWAPDWDVLEWAKALVQEHSDKSVILACHAYMDKDGSLLGAGDAHCPSSYYPGYPDGTDVWAAFKDCGNVVLAMGGHIHCEDLVTFTDQNGAGREVTSLLVDRQNDDGGSRYAMLALLTFHEGSETVDVNWYSTRYDALFRAKNQFSITVPPVCEHSYASAAVGPTCTEGDGTKYTCTLCGYSYLEETSEPLGHDFETVFTAPDCTSKGYAEKICSVCGYTEREAFPCDITEQFQWNEGRVISATGGNMGTDKNWVASDYVDISAYTSIEIVTGDTVNAETTLGLAFYDANKKYISGVTHTDKVGDVYGYLVHDLEVPEHAVYVRTTWYSVNHEKYDGATRQTFYCKGYSTEIPALGHSLENNVCTACGLIRSDLTAQFTNWTEGGPVLFSDGWGYGESGYTSGSNKNLKYSDFVCVEGIDTLELTVCARTGHSATGGYAFYTDKRVESFISEGASTRNGNGAAAEGTVLHTITVPEGAKYIRVSYWVDGSAYAAVPFSCAGYKKVCAHTFENGVCTICGADAWDTDGDGALEILAIGNSFSVDALEYAWQIADSLGIEEIVIGNLYIGGCSLKTHAANAAGDLAKYTYYYNDSGSWRTTKNYKISTALAERDWDCITLQQWSATSGVESSYNEDLTDLIGYVKARSGAKLGWHMTWSYQQDSTHTSFPTYGSDQMTMYNAIVSAVENKILTNGDLEFVIPSGTAVQNSRTSLLGDTTTRDGYHMSRDYGRYLTGLMFIETVTGLSVEDVEYRPEGVSELQQKIAVESVNHASERPFAVTASAYTDETTGVTVRGTVKGSRGAKVTLLGAESCETTDSYEFTGVAQGVYDLIIEEGGCLTHTVKNITVETDDIILPEIELVRGDMNGDEMINARDIGVFRRDFGKAATNCANPYTDLNGDGNVNARDINLLRRSFGKSAAKDCTVEYTA